MPVSATIQPYHYHHEVVVINKVSAERNELLLEVKSLPIGSHTLFYRVTTDTVEIIRVLHGRQDPQRHLK